VTECITSRPLAYALDFGQFAFVELEQGHRKGEPISRASQQPGKPYPGALPETGRQKKDQQPKQQRVSFFVWLSKGKNSLFLLS
jgi:hypothetical protein